MNPLLKIVLLLGVSSWAHADFSNDGVPVSPEVVARIVSGAQRYGEPLESKATKEERTVYYLRRAEYIGECVAPFDTVHIAELFFIRSGVRGQPTPPPRGHTFLVFYDSNFRVRGYWRDQGGPYRFEGTKLLEDGRVIFDYAESNKYTAVPPGQWPHPPIWEQPKRQQDGGGQPATRAESK